MIQTIIETFSCFDKDERRQSAGLFALMVAMALLEAIGVASVMPFVAVIADPTIIEKHRILKVAYLALGNGSFNRFVMLLGMAAICLAVVSASVRTITIYWQGRFIESRRYSLSKRLLAGYLGQPYEFFLSRNTAELGRNILSEVDVFVERGLMPIAYMTSHLFVLLAITAVLFLLNPLVTCLIFCTFGLLYLMVYLSLRGVLDNNGTIRSSSNRLRYESATEALAAIKILKVTGMGGAYLDRFSSASRDLARSMTISNISVHIPKYVVETFAFIGIILVMIAALGAQDATKSIAGLLPMLSLYAFAGYRMLPAVQQVYSNVTTLRFAKPAVQTIANELASIAACSEPCSRMPPLPFNEKIELKNIYYNYPESAAGLRDISLTIQKGDRIAIVGRTGSGKTTLVDVILGLLIPNCGEISVDGRVLDVCCLDAWQGNIGYVPQDIMLLDGTVAENIALGLPHKDVNQTKLERAAEIANIHQFIVNNLPEQYASQVGQRGARLSGGQRQRIAIARAVYHDPQLLIFDEATSALDMLTEADINLALNKFGPEKTIINISHRRETSLNFTRVVEIRDGRIVHRS